MFRRCLTIALSALLLSVLSAPALAVDVNRATQAELEELKGVGPALSGRILEARKAGPFKDWTDMVDRVSGIGPGNAARLSQAGLTVGGSAYAGAAQKAPAAKAEKTGKTAPADKTATASKT